MTGLLLASALATIGVDRPVDFDTEVVPILTRAGCNAGACHGAAIGRGGFQLSLLGSDPAHDFDAIARDLEGRRVDLARPASSLLLAKPTGRLDHEGGLRLARDGEPAARLLAWVEAGARRLATRRLESFAVDPAWTVVEPGAEVALRAVARFDDGSTEDVTGRTLFTAADPSALALDPARATAVVRRRGPSTIIARYLDRVVPLTLVVPLNDEPVALTAQSRANFVDDEVLAMLGTLRLPPSPRADDPTFLRRVTLDLTGRLPTLAEQAEFRAEPDRARLVDRLLGSDAFVDLWTFRLAGLLRLRAQGNDPTSLHTYHAWLRARVAEGTPFDAVARELLTADGDSHAVGPANFQRTAADPRAEAELVGRVFLGVRLQCANCHNHPLDRWTQDDYHGLAAVFARVDRGRVVGLLPRGEVTNPRTGEPAAPRIPGVRDLEPGRDGRAELAGWLTDPANPALARATVNRLWKALMGRGLVEPVDDLSQTNPATHPALLDRLAADFRDHGFDLRHTLRTIALSEAYARSAAPLAANRADDRFYSHALVRPLEPEILADALVDVTGTAGKLNDLPEGGRAVALVDPATPAPALDILGRCSRQDSCEPGATAGSGLPVRLHRINGRLINERVAHPEGRLRRWIDEGRTDAEIVALTYQHALARDPSAEEAAAWRDRLGGIETPDRVPALEDFFWALLNCREFVTNH